MNIRSLACFAFGFASSCAIAQPYDSTRDSMVLLECVAKRLPSELSNGTVSRTATSSGMADTLRTHLPDKLRPMFADWKIPHLDKVRTAADANAAIQIGEKLVEHIQQEMTKGFQLTDCGDNAQVQSASYSILAEWVGHAMQSDSEFVLLDAKFVASKQEPAMFGFLLGTALSGEPIRKDLADFLRSFAAWLPSSTSKTGDVPLSSKHR